MHVTVFLRYLVYCKTDIRYDIQNDMIIYLLFEAFIYSSSIRQLFLGQRPVLSCIELFDICENAAVKEKTNLVIHSTKG